MTRLEDAVCYAHLGWAVFPVSSDKVPRTPHGHLDATTDEDVIRAHWERHPDDNIGVNLAMSGLCAVDFDPRNGEEQLEELERALVPLPRHCMASTPAGGIHLVMRGVPGRRPRGRAVYLGERYRALDFKQNGFVLLEPSARADGRAYEWLAFSKDVPEVPAAWIDVLYHPDVAGAEAPEHSPDGWDESSDPEISADDSARLRIFLRDLKRGEGRNSTFRAVSAIFHDWGLGTRDGWPYLTEWNEASGKPHDERELHRQVHRIAMREHSGARGRSRLDIPMGERFARAAARFGPTEDEDEPHPVPMSVTPDIPSRPAVAQSEVDAHLRVAAGKLARDRKSPRRVEAGRLIASALSGHWAPPPSEDRGLALAKLATVLVAHAPAGTADHQLAAFIPDAGAVAAVAEARACPVAPLVVVADDGAPAQSIARPSGDFDLSKWGTDSWVLETFGPTAGRPKARSQTNCKLALHRLGITLHRDTFAERERAIVPGANVGDFPVEKPITIEWCSDTAFRIERTFCFLPDKNFLFDVVGELLRERERHPVRDYLDGLAWDSVPRVDTWLRDYFGAEDSPYVRAIGRLLLVAAVRRIRRPGCQFDEMVVLESPEGYGKSGGFRALVGDAWFTDSMPLDAGMREAIEQMHGKWVIECAELEGMGKRDLAALKAFCSRRADRARLAYGRTVTEAPRQCVFVGTTNESGYLKDEFRRIWPVRVAEVDVDGIARDRDQLWAEAAAAEATGESIRLARDLWPAAAEARAERIEEDPFLARLAEAGLGDVVGRLRVTAAWSLLGLAVERMSDQTTARITRAMRSLGWEKSRQRFGGALAYCYARGTPKEREIEVQVQGGRLKFSPHP